MIRRIKGNIKEIATISASMEVCKDKELCHLQKLCMSSPKSVAQKLILAHLNQMSDLNYSVKLGTSIYAGYTPLHFLAMCLNIVENETIKLMKWLIDQGADINAQNAIGSTVIHTAAEFGKKIVLEFLFSCDKVLINVINKKGISYLHIACKISNTDIAQRILNSTGTEIMNNQVTLLNLTTKDRFFLDNKYNGGETALHIAVLNNSLSIVQLLIDHTVDLNRKNDEGFTPLQLATEYNFLEIQSILKKAMCPSHTEDSEGSKNLPKSSRTIRVANSKVIITGYSKLHFMCMENYVLGIKRLLKEKVDVNESISQDSPSWSGFTALHIAVIQGNLKIAQLLLSNGADVNVKDIKGMTPLHFSVKEKRWSISELLINHGAGLWVKNVKEITPFYLALSKYSEQDSISKKIISFYVAAFQSINEKSVDEFGISLLHVACITNNPLMVINSLQENIAIDSCIKFDSPLFPGYTPLHLAVKFKNSQLVQILLDNCADHTLMNANGLTPLHLAQKLNNFKIVELIFSAHYFKIDNPISSEGISHFHIACMRNQIEAVERYIKHNVDVNQPIDFFAENELSGCTPLHIAVNKCYVELIKVLLNHEEIMINTGDSFGSSPLHYACQMDLKEIVEMLLKNAANPNAENFLGKRPIEIVIRQNNEILLKILLNYKVELNYFNVVNRLSPLYLVVDSKTLNYQIFKMLLNNGVDPTVTYENGLTVMHKMLNKCLINFKSNSKVGTNGMITLISQLCWKGCDIDCQDEQGRTPLHIAIQNCNINDTLALMRNGADINIIDDSGKTPLQYGVNINSTDDSAKNPFQYYYEQRLWSIFFITYFIDHILTLKISNSYIHQKNNEWCLHFDFYDNSAIELLQELQIMKQYKLSRYTTLYDVLHKTPNEMATLVKNKMFKNSIHSSSKLRAEIPNYYDLLLSKYNKGVISKSLIQPAKDSLTKLSNGLEIPDACFEEIFKFLTINDMRRLIRSNCVFKL